MESSVHKCICTHRKSIPGQRSKLHKPRGNRRGASGLEPCASHLRGIGVALMVVVLVGFGAAQAVAEVESGPKNPWVSLELGRIGVRVRDWFARWFCVVYNKESA